MQHAADNLPDLVPRDDVQVRANDPLFKKIAWTEALKRDALALPLLDLQPGFSFAHAIGPVQLLVADLRTERSHEQVLGPDTWTAMKAWLKQIPENGRKHPGEGCQHLLFMSSVPVVHPKLSLAEAFLDNFGSDHVLDSSADDLKDHWTHDDHEGERLRLLETLFATAKAKQLRVAIVSGDVHVAAHGVAYRKDVGPPRQLGADSAVHIDSCGAPVAGICGGTTVFSRPGQRGQDHAKLGRKHKCRDADLSAVEPAGFGCAELAGD